MNLSNAVQTVTIILATTLTIPQANAGDEQSAKEVFNKSALSQPADSTMLVKPLKPSVETTIDVPAHIEIAESIGALKHKVESEAQAHQMALEEFESNFMLCEDRICQSNALTSLKNSHMNYGQTMELNAQAYRTNSKKLLDAAKANGQHLQSGIGEAQDEVERLMKTESSLTEITKLQAFDGMNTEDKTVFIKAFDDYHLNQGLLKNKLIGLTDLKTSLGEYQAYAKQYSDVWSWLSINGHKANNQATLLASNIALIVSSAQHDGMAGLATGISESLSYGEIDMPEFEPSSNQSSSGTTIAPLRKPELGITPMAEIKAMLDAIANK